jgi:hypothetical protein
MSDVYRRVAMVVVALGTVAAIAAAAPATKVPIRRGELPASVRRTLEAHYPGAKVLGLFRETDQAGVSYEAEMKVSERRVDVVFDPKGVVQVEEKQVKLGELPARVRTALARHRGPRSTVERMERLTGAEVGRSPRYEFLVREGRTFWELVFDPNGKLVGKKKVARGD